MGPPGKCKRAAMFPGLLRTIKRSWCTMLDIDSHKIMLLILYGVLIIVLTIASVVDLYQRRIPNLVSLPTVILAPFIYYMIAGLDGVLFSLGGLAFGFLLFLFPYLMGGLGAGDVKLLAAVGSVLGVRFTAYALLFIALAGGGMALGVVLYRRTFRKTLLNIFGSLMVMGVFHDASIEKVAKKDLMQDGIPFAVAILCGVCLFFIYAAVTKETLSVFGVLLST